MGSATTPRRLFGLIRLAAGMTIVIALAFQIQDLVAHNGLIPGHYFAFFTIQSSMINVVVLLAGGVYALGHARDTVLLSSIQLSALCYAVVTAAVYNLLLRGVPTTDYVGIQWPNEVLHVWIPIVLFLDWILGPGRARLPFRSLGVVVSYPIAWAAFTLIRGPFYGWYPYPFIDPKNGVPSLIGYIVGLTIFILVLASLAILRTRASASRPGQPSRA
jgi:hypothetical protein